MLVWLLQRAEPTPHDSGGKQRLFRTGIMAETFSRSGHEVVWWTSTFDHYNRRQRFLTNTRVQVRDNYSIQYLKGYGYQSNISVARVKENRKVSKAFAKLAEDEANFPDIIVASIPTTELAKEAIRFAKPRNITVALDVRDLWPDFIIESVPYLLKPFAYIALLPLRFKTGWVFRNADAVIGLTDEFLNWGLSFAAREKRSQDRVFPMGYMKRSLSDEEIAEGTAFWKTYKVGGYDGVLNVIFIGSMSRSYDLYMVLKAARLLRENGAPIRFILCGDGEQFSNLKMIGDSLDNVVMPGWINDIQIRTLLELSHVGLAPYIDSPNYIKNLPNKPAEYLSAGLVIGTSLSSGPLVNLISQYGCGFSYTTHADILAEKLMHYTNEMKLHEARKNSIRIFESFLDGKKIYLDMIRYFEKIGCTFRNK